MEARTYNPNTQKAEAIQGQPRLRGEFLARHGYVARPYLRKQKKQKEKDNLVFFL